MKPTRILLSSFAAILGLAQSLPATSTLQFTNRIFSLTENAGSAQITVVRTGDPLSPVSVDYFSVAARATPGLDYDPTGGSLIFASGQTNQILHVTIVNDGWTEIQEDFRLYLTNAAPDAALGAISQITVRIVDNDSPVTFSQPAYSASETQNVVNVSVIRGDDGDSPVSLDFTTIDGTALHENDYQAVTGSLTLEKGEQSRTVQIPLLNDSLLEGTETFSVQLLALHGDATLGSRTNATVSILDNDRPIQVEFGAYSALENEPIVTIAITRDGEWGPFAVDYATADGDAIANEDYIAASGTLTFGPDEHLKLIEVPILNDAVREPGESFRLYLTNAPPDRLGYPASTTIGIRDNDPGIGFRHTVTWRRDTEGVARLEVLRGSDVDLRPFTIDYATSSLGAVPDQDYRETSGTLRFAEGDLTQCIEIPLLNNPLSHVDRQLRLTLANPSNNTSLGSNSFLNLAILNTTGMLPHQLQSLQWLPSGEVELRVQGGSHPRFTDYFDLYPLEVSSNLIDWTPLTILHRTNAESATLRYRHSAPPDADQQYYRLATNHLLTAMLKPTGPFSVGTVDRWLTDPNRRNRFAISTNGSFMATLWYPATPLAGQLPVTCEDEALLTDPVWVGGLYDREPYFVSHAIADAPCNNTATPYPIVLFSHGAGAYRYQAAEKAQNLASHGYFVVGIDHFDAGHPTFPDGSIGVPGVASLGMEDRVRDLEFILDTLTQWNDSDPHFAGQLDLSRVAATGFSWGGYTAAEFCRLDPRCHAAVLLDPGGTSGELLQAGLPKPFLQINNGANADSTLLNPTTRDAVWLQITETEHAHFDDFYWWSFPNNVAACREAARTINAYLLWFLNRHLKGASDPMPNPADYPRAANLKTR
jgi:dienelactone hydrolase